MERSQFTKARQPKIKFIDKSHSAFFSTVRERVDTYFKTRSLSSHANTAMWFKSIFFLLGYLLLYGLILSGQFNAWTMLAMAGGLGIFAATIGFNVSHDAVHGAFSGHKWVNDLLSKSFYLLGASPYIWNLTHNVVHHTYTNIIGHDEDIEIAPGLIRVDPQEKINRLQRFQHLYAFFLYSLTSLSWVLRKDYLKFFHHRIGAHSYTHPRKEYFNLFFYKALYYFFFIVLPLVLLDLSWWQVGLGFVIMHLIEGITLGLVFQLAHVVEGTNFPTPNAQGNMEDAWAVHQLRTTANFAPDSKLAAFLCGGLNRQIEHHLFPKICHVHYPALSVIVRHTAQEFGLPYLENKTFFIALQSHYRMLRKLGKDAFVPSTTVQPTVLPFPLIKLA
ncbi:acyl-CoA desaturase [Xanthocytophaga agilis]|uniref:Acyl-CoA desaturase n=1 Tax=Xanthocytophaga agilis TaxID=3048010 RepID=A0AAE3R2C2_9BACT|nr:acyl-CoA desaturase [Xanthocytophaga agilis]MDJ1499387.1 acyl-CoA desaturase [Xanthocytophaga agilis]